ncbi:hypothetical protein B0H10DRAFT_817636 [Mycena sp. CBHHK59/15]|nr:hypothetical protein B0H10DRAFT_817636 [Mycena sp. CBHHK59/15]
MSTAASAPSTPAPEASTTSSLLQRIPTQKIASYIRFKTQRTDKRPPVIFPPPSWSLDEMENDGTGASDWSYDPATAKEGISIEDAPEPHTFAQRIGTLIDSLPFPAPTKDADIGVVDPEGPPLPGSVTADSKLMKLLSSENVMNGSVSLGRRSVWSMLEQLKHRHAPPENSGSNKGEENKGEQREDQGVMMYAPLQPTQDSELELADSEMVLEYLDEPEETGKVNPAAGSNAPPDPQVPQQPEGSPTKKPEGVKPSKSRKRKAKEHIHWVPSPTKISLQVMWWGYRLYLPPPVMKILDNTHLAAARRGAMITAALKWLLDKVPMMMIPPPLRPAMMVLKRLTPFLGYIGVFIAWSWTAFKARDKGDGVVLTATWLLPVALVPASLKAEDYQYNTAGGATVPKGDKPAESTESGPKDTKTTPESDSKTTPKSTDDAHKADESVQTPSRWMSFRREKSKGKSDKLS